MLRLALRNLPHFFVAGTIYSLLSLLFLKIAHSLGHHPVIPSFVMVGSIGALMLLVPHIWSLFWKVTIGFGLSIGAFLLIEALSHNHKKFPLLQNLTLDLIVLGLIVFSLLGLYLFRKFQLSPIDRLMKRIDNFGKGHKASKQVGGQMFEDFLINLYKSAGIEAYSSHEIKKHKMFGLDIKGFDQGADIYLKRINSDGNPYVELVQCKHYSSNISNKAVQEIVAAKAVYGADVATVISNQFYTEAAIQLAQKNGVNLIDRNRLRHMLIETMRKTSVFTHNRVDQVA